MYLYLMMGVFWLVLGVAMVGWSWVDPESPYTRIIGTNFPAGWLGVVLAVWNFARWWNARAQEQERELTQSHEGRRKGDPRYSTFKQHEEIKNPEFDFTKDQPPKEGEGKGQA